MLVISHHETIAPSLVMQLCSCVQVPLVLCYTAVSRYHLSIQLFPGFTCPFSYVQVPLVLSAVSRLHLSFQLCPGTTCPLLNSCVQVPLVHSAVSRFHLSFQLCPGTTCPFSCVWVPLVLSTACLCIIDNLRAFT